MQVNIERTYLKQLAKLPKYIINTADDVKQKLEASKSLQTSGVDYQKMSGRDNRYRIRIGDYRIIAEYISPKIILLIIVNRSDVYKK